MHLLFFAHALPADYQCTTCGHPADYPETVKANSAPHTELKLGDFRVVTWRLLRG